MALGVSRTIVAGCLAACALQGCSRGAEPNVPPKGETSGGELTADADTEIDRDGSAAVATTDPSLAANAEASPWGATRAEKCRRPPRKPIADGAQRSFTRGVRAASSNDTASARSNFQSALSEDPNAYPALYNLGVLADRTGNEADAIDYYRKALRVQPDYEPAARGIATIELRQGDAAGAVRVVEPLARKYPTNLELQALYAEVLVDAKRYQQAWMAARKALECDERFVPALIALVKVSLAQGREELADSILSQAMTVDPDTAELHYLEGERLKDEPGRLRDAMAAYERAVELRPDYAEARMALGIQMLAGGNYPVALTHFEAAEKLVPTLPAVYVNLGDAYRATKQWEKSEKAYERALQLQSKLPEAHFGLGLLYLSSAGELPGLDEVSALQRSQREFRTYRAEMGPRLRRGDQSGEYLEDLDRMIKRAKRRIERDRERAKRERERGPKEEGGTE